jgi:hypothetical protein
MAKRMRPWVKDVLVFVGLALLNFALILPCAFPLNKWAPNRGVRPSELWLWAFATPAMVARELGGTSVAVVVIWLNPLFYGLMWWAVWRMFRLMRAKPREDESPPLHNE